MYTRISSRHKRPRESFELAKPTSPNLASANSILDSKLSKFQSPSSILPPQKRVRRSSRLRKKSKKNSLFGHKKHSKTKNSSKSYNHSQSIPIPVIHSEDSSDFSDSDNDEVLSEILDDIYCEVQIIRATLRRKKQIPTTKTRPYLPFSDHECEAIKRCIPFIPYPAWTQLLHTLRYYHVINPYRNRFSVKDKCRWMLKYKEISIDDFQLKKYKNCPEITIIPYKSQNPESTVCSQVVKIVPPGTFDGIDIYPSKYYCYPPSSDILRKLVTQKMIQPVSSKFLSNDTNLESKYSPSSQSVDHPSESYPIVISSSNKKPSKPKVGKTPDVDFVLGSSDSHSLLDHHQPQNNQDKPTNSSNNTQKPHFSLFSNNSDPQKQTYQMDHEREITNPRNHSPLSPPHSPIRFSSNSYPLHQGSLSHRHLISTSLLSSPRSFIWDPKPLSNANSSSNAFSQSQTLINSQSAISSSSLSPNNLEISSSPLDNSFFLSSST